MHRLEMLFELGEKVEETRLERQNEPRTKSGMVTQLIGSAVRLSTGRYRQGQDGAMYSGGGPIKRVAGGLGGTSHLQSSIVESKDPGLIFFSMSATTLTPGLSYIVPSSIVHPTSFLEVQN